jgi:hypothetical protein
VLVAEDTFDSNLRNGWGATDAGGAYELVGEPSDFDVSAGTGTITLRRSASPRGAYLDELSLTDLTVSVRVRTDRAPSGARQFIYISMRRSEGSEHLAKLSFSPDGSVFVGAGYLLRGSDEEEVSLGPELKLDGVRHEPGAWFTISADIRGTHPTVLRVRAWRDGNAKPESLIDVVVDDERLQDSGGVGVRAYLGGEYDDLPVTISFDDLRVGL